MPQTAPLLPTTQPSRRPSTASEAPHRRKISIADSLASVAKSPIGIGAGRFNASPQNLDDAPVHSLSPSTLRSQSVVLGSLGMAQNDKDFRARFHDAISGEGEDGQLLEISSQSSSEDGSGSSQRSPGSDALSTSQSNLTLLLHRATDGAAPSQVNRDAKSSVPVAEVNVTGGASSDAADDADATASHHEDHVFFDEEPTDRTPLLATDDGSDNRSRPASHSRSTGPSNDSRRRISFQEPRLSFADRRRSAVANMSRRLKAFDLRAETTQAILYLPAVMLGLILNLLDAISYGLIIFPVSIPVFRDLGPDGVSMFFVSTVLSQLVYSLGGSTFRCGNGSMMIEVVPFLHIMAQTVVAEIGNPEVNSGRIVATTLMTYAFSTIMTGFAFLALGCLNLGALVGFFPRHILVGCIGGVGYFLLQTAFEVTTRMTGHLSLQFFQALFEAQAVALWGSSLGLALLLRAVNCKIKHPMFVPCFFLMVPILFYAVVLIAGVNLSDLREEGWLFALPSSDIPFYHFYTQFDFRAVDWGSVTKNIPAMLALTFFGILHVPINVPALGVSCGIDNVNTNRELVGHGISNLVSGCFGSVQNYLVYSNSVLFLKSGGDSRVAGVMLAIATSIIYFMGPSVIGYIPVMVVGSLIFHLGIELMKESLVDTFGVVHTLEYVTIILIVMAMAFWGFIEGIFLGIILACFFFVYNNARKNVIRSSFTGQNAKSTVRRVVRQQQFLHGAGAQIRILKLQGYMFFGTVGQLEKDIRSLLDEREWRNNPIRFLILDMTAASGMDFSAAEAFLRIKRLLLSRSVHFIVCGLDGHGEIGKALQKVNLWGGDQRDHVHSFSVLDEALEWSENQLLESWYRKKVAISERRERRMTARKIAAPDQSQSVASSFATSLRDRRLTEAAKGILGIVPHLFAPKGIPWESSVLILFFQDDASVSETAQFPEPMSMLMQAFCDVYSEKTGMMSLDTMLFRIAPKFNKIFITKGDVVYHQGDAASHLYLVEEGSIRISMSLNVDHSPTQHRHHHHHHHRHRKSKHSQRPDGASSNQNSHQQSEIAISIPVEDDFVEDEDAEGHEGLHRRIETVLPGALLGELRFLTETVRAGTAVAADSDAVLWQLSREDHDKLCEEHPRMMVEFHKLVMKYTLHRIDVITMHAFTLQH